MAAGFPAEPEPHTARCTYQAEHVRAASEDKALIRVLGPSLVLKDSKQQYNHLNLRVKINPTTASDQVADRGVRRSRVWLRVGVAVGCTVKQHTQRWGRESSQTADQG